MSSVYEWAEWCAACCLIFVTKKIFLQGVVVDLMLQYQDIIYQMTLQYQRKMILENSFSHWHDSIAFSISVNKL